jgi:hypothetical protein
MANATPPARRETPTTSERRRRQHAMDECSMSLEVYGSPPSYYQRS